MLVGLWPKTFGKPLDALPSHEKYEQY